MHGKNNYILFESTSFLTVAGAIDGMELGTVADEVFRGVTKHAAPLAVRVLIARIF